MINYIGDVGYKNNILIDYIGDVECKNGILYIRIVNFIF
jgi:hypothetical protein